MKLKKDEKAFVKIKIFEMILASIFVIFGVLLFVGSFINEDLVKTILGILVILEAIVNIYSTIMPNSNSFYKPNLLFGILYLVIGVFFFINPIKLVNYIQIYYGVYLALSGLKLLVFSIKLKVIGDASFLITLVMSILTIALGGLLVFYQFQGFTIIELVAIFSILTGIINIGNANLLKTRVKKIISKVDSE